MIWFQFLRKQRRITFVDCPNDTSDMIDAVIFADLALLLIDGSYGFEMVSFLSSRELFLICSSKNKCQDECWMCHYPLIFSPHDHFHG